MDPVLLRKQLKENASDLQDFCSDLKKWGDEMKRKEEALKNDYDGDKISELKKMRKPTRDKPKKEVTFATKKLERKIGGTDYAAWDKFDAEAECEKLEDDNDDSDLTDECNENLQDLALVEKENGNKFVKNKKWDEAIKSYTKAIEYYSFDPIFYANRALCYLKKSKFEEAEEDCTLALKLDSTYVKAYLRRAAANEALGKFEHAEYDLQKVLELEPNNKESKQALVTVQNKLGRMEKPTDQRPVSKFTASRNKSNIVKTPVIQPIINSVESKAPNIELKKEIDTSKPVPPWPEKEDIVVVKPINKPPHLRSTKPLKRVKITEKSDTVLEESEPASVAVKQHVFEKKQETEMVEAPTRNISPVAVKQHVFEKKQETQMVEPPTRNISNFKAKQMKKSIDASEQSEAWPRPGQTTLTLKSSDFKIIERKAPDSTTTTTEPLTISKDVKNTSNINLSMDIKKKDSNEISNNFVKPKTSVQFNLTWKNLKSTEEKYKYLKQVDPQDIPKIFLESLESNVFSGILEVLAVHFIENKDPVFSILENFTQVKRFGTFTMFMSSSDKKNLWKLFDYVKEVEDKSKEDVDRLIQKYEL